MKNELINKIVCLSVVATIFVATSFIFIINTVAATTTNSQEGGLNITRTLLLQVNSTLDDDDKQRVIQDGYTITLHVKGNWYSDKVIKSIAEILDSDPIIQIPIINNEDQHDDGSDFRVDVSVNNYDDRFIIVNYPIKYNSTFESVDITPLIKYVIQDTKKEAENNNNNNNNDDDYHKDSSDYAIILDRPNNDKDDREHAKVKDPEHN